MSGPLKILVYSHYGTGKSLHPHIIPRKRREAGCVSTGTAARNERLGVSLMKSMILRFPVSCCEIFYIQYARREAYIETHHPVN